ncbi:hypothetical protein QWY20_15840 [Alkalimonas sp. MEB108]|uniref:Uncharacterized protein n=1 Tax=Alkalimonas cellulosilytica TaxID=3058395 RepID=A0ABU7J958_9GAMM|nr:hypothetical protein [Alkalimonas sp. MEB108]MEE2002929.1 hypothetical protein [Alkalimonas sp. MEB108]
MQVNTVSMKLGVRIEKAEAKDNTIVMSGYAGTMPCETIVTAEEAASLFRMCFKPAILKLVIRAFFRRNKQPDKA